MGSEISRENEQFIEEQVASGTFRSRSEAMDAGVEVLRLRNELLNRVDEGRRQLDSGEYIEYDEDALKSRFEQLKARVRNVGQNEIGRAHV